MVEFIREVLILARRLPCCKGFPRLYSNKPSTLVFLYHLYSINIIVILLLFKTYLTLHQKN
jgi:hypothetical protein